MEAIEYVYDDRSGLYRRVRYESVSPRAIVVGNEAVADLVAKAFGGPCMRVKSRSELIAETSKPGAVVFVACDLLSHVDPKLVSVPFVGVTNDSPATLPAVIRALAQYPWLSHFVSVAMLSRPLAHSHLTKLVAQLALGSEQNMVTEAGVGRVALLACASHREARLERMRRFFEEHGVSPRAIEKISEVFEEVVTNALYDAPLEAGYFQQAVPRTEDVKLEPEHACEISYAIEDSMAYVRIRDTFGALTRARLLAVLERCNTNGVALDVSRGGAGLGLWRVFSAASTVSIVVDPGRLTEILVGISTKDKRGTLLAVDLFFAASRYATPAARTDHDLIDQSITLVSA